jgi:hypothetical protein
MQTPPPQFTQPDITLPNLTLEELRTHHQRQNFCLLAKYGTEESWPHDQVMHMQRLEQAIAQREEGPAISNTSPTVQEDDELGAASKGSSPHDRLHCAETGTSPAPNRHGQIEQESRQTHATSPRQQRTP